MASGNPRNPMTSTLLDKDLYDALNVVALKKMSTAAGVADTTTLDLDAAQAALATLADRNLIVLVGDNALPTDASAETLTESAAEIYASVRTDPAVLAVADKFEDVNARFLRAMSAWQQIEVGGRKITNDHSDSDYDNKIISQIDKLVSRLAGLLETLGERDPRFRIYITRFRDSLDKVDAGDIAFVSDPTRDSVHNVWFEFHEDLLRTLGRKRKE
ncbi:MULTISPECIES: hypothetical protein [unclassified Gordonia (in: high G+C Gram-positive bacteria)]|uniref:hypothetical protein n=1 Tax=unclassified Gordonia (in: high G+C Gram-positive bacteria) TaxID=2657482 RepID=UPI001C0B9E4D|nr:MULTISPECIES: hypothetical protein [unclassified Gordonia (in: high G+C Gram-positive bacteria)]MDF3281141.1 hypothetical protein [Gordonia sp. N1V]